MNYFAILKCACLNMYRHTVGACLVFETNLEPRISVMPFFCGSRLSGYSLLCHIPHFLHLFNMVDANF